jgi:DNA-binding NarL/FixJ family response regulator
VKKTIVIYGALIVALLALFQLSKYSLMYSQDITELVIVIIAVIFLGIGLFINKKRNSQLAPLTNSIDEAKIKELGISKREYEVLQLISNGLSNKEIADQLFLSESTIKTHVSNLLTKLDAKRRTQAIQIAKSLQIL